MIRKLYTADVISYYRDDIRPARNYRDTLYCEAANELDAQQKIRQSVARANRITRRILNLRVVPGPLV